MEFGGALPGTLSRERDVIVSRQTCRFHHRYYGLMCRLRVGTDDNYGVRPIPGCLAQVLANLLGARGRHLLAIDRIAPIGAHCYVDDIRRIRLFLRCCLREADLEFREFRVARGNHQEYQNDQQYINHGYQIDFRFFFLASTLKVHAIQFS
jgi:hypothetical protein